MVKVGISMLLKYIWLSLTSLHTHYTGNEHQNHHNFMFRHRYVDEMFVLCEA